MTMKRNLTAVAVAALLVVLVSPLARSQNALREDAEQLPECNSPEVREVLQGILRSSRIGEPTDLKSDTDEKRWCTTNAMVRVLIDISAYPARGRMPFETFAPRQITFTIEWINAAEGRFWVQTK
jgi:hypothetical protein